jgi:hypothetical protein
MAPAFVNRIMANSIGAVHAPRRNRDGAAKARRAARAVLTESAVVWSIRRAAGRFRYAVLQHLKIGARSSKLGLEMGV